jgi:hypothetical protein
LCDFLSNLSHFTMLLADPPFSAGSAVVPGPSFSLGRHAWDE